jgi:hypothetical protein
MKLVEALGAAGIELIGEGAMSHSGGRGVRLRDMSATRTTMADIAPASGRR